MEALLDDWEKISGDKAKEKALSEEFASFGITNPAVLFKDKEYGKAAFTTFAFFGSSPIRVQISDQEMPV